MLSLTELKKELKALANPDIAQHSARFFKTGKGEYGEGDKFCGIRVPALRKLVKKCGGISIEETITLLKSVIHEERLLAALILVYKYKKSDVSDKKLIFDLYLSNMKYINNWDIVDSSAEHIVGHYLMEKLKNKPKALLYELAKSKDLWERRISIISTFHFIRKNSFKDTFEISKMLLNDKEDLIHKAVGWMLREAGNRNRAEEEFFLKKHYQQMPRTMLRYAIEKFPEALRQKYLKGNI